MEQNMTRKDVFTIAIDGPAAAGKSTVAKQIANELSYIYIDTGAMYRALTLKVLNKHIETDDAMALSDTLSNTMIELKQSERGQIILLDEEDVTDEIRSSHVTANVSHIAKHPAVRRQMVKRQQAMADYRDVVMDGRDIGTHVLPDAQVKIFLVASAKERAKRRYEENMEKGIPSDLNELQKEIEERDRLDSKREASPLIKAEDAIEIDTTALSINEVTQQIINVILKVQKNNK